MPVNWDLLTIHFPCTLYCKLGNSSLWCIFSRKAERRRAVGTALVSVLFFGIVQFRIQTCKLHSGKQKPWGEGDFPLCKAALQGPSRLSPASLHLPTVSESATPVNCHSRWRSPGECGFLHLSVPPGCSPGLCPC